MKTTARKRKSTRSGRKTGTRSATRRLLGNSANTALRGGRRTLSRVYDWANETTAGSRLRDMRLPSRRQISAFTEANPLILGAVGLGLGVAIGTLIPRARRRSASRRMMSRGNGAVATKSTRGRRPKRRGSSARTTESTATAQ